MIDHMAGYLKRYEPDDNGLRFQDLVYQGNFKGMEPVPDGILGDKIMRQRAKSKVLEKVSHQDVLRDNFTIDARNTRSWRLCTSSTAGRRSCA